MALGAPPLEDPASGRGCDLHLSRNRSDGLAATMTLSQLAVSLGAQVDRGLAAPLITRGSSLAAAEPGCRAFAEEEVSFAAARASSAAAVLVSEQVGPQSGSKPVLRV